mmetsp:Transcript_30763/g.52626  ORF Transcript_30763/g.52626 Transcript_30763/m.52626 type:complete len:200 (+) Transcript_30763:1001-1600(+)
MRRPATEPSSFVMISCTGVLVRTLPPRDSMWAFMGAQTRSGWLPSRKAICRPLSSLRNLFIAVSTTVIESLSGSIKSSAFPIAMKISSLIRSGMPYLRINWRTESSSCRSMKSCPSRSIGSSPGTIFSFSSTVSIFVLPRIASAMLNGAGTPSANSKEVNSPGRSCMAKVMRCGFHCRRSSISSSANKFIMFGYAPKKM